MKKEKLIEMLNNPVAKKIVDTLNVLIYVPMLAYDRVKSVDIETAKREIEKKIQNSRDKPYMGYFESSEIGSHKKVYYSYEPCKTSKIEIQINEDSYSIWDYPDDRFQNHGEGETTRSLEKLILNLDNLEKNEDLISSLPDLQDEPIKKSFRYLIFKKGIVQKLESDIEKKFDYQFTWNYGFEEMNGWYSELRGILCPVWFLAENPSWEDLEKSLERANRYSSNYLDYLVYLNELLKEQIQDGIVIRKKSKYENDQIFLPRLTNEEHNTLCEEDSINKLIKRVAKDKKKIQKDRGFNSFGMKCLINKFFKK